MNKKYLPGSASVVSNFLLIELIEQLRPGRSKKVNSFFQDDNNYLNEGFFVRKGFKYWILSISVC